MNILSYLFKNPTKLLIILVLILAIMILGSFLFFAISTPKPQSSPFPVIEYRPSPSSSAIIPSAPPAIAPTALNPEERNYPEASPQRFFTDNTNRAGILIVTSNPSGARVMIDSEEAEVSSTGTVLPVNITPFKASNIPTGKHNLTLFKKGYNLAAEQFEIKPNEITRLDTTLTPQESNIGY